MAKVITTFSQKCEEYQGYDERFPSRQVVVSTDCNDMSSVEFFEFVKSFMLACGYAEESFYQACEEFSKEWKRDIHSLRNRYKVGETQFKEFISPDYEEKLKQNIEKLKEEDRI